MENKKKHILVVDDDDRIRDLLKEYLNSKNFIISTAVTLKWPSKKLYTLSLI